MYKLCTIFLLFLSFKTFAQNGKVQWDSNYKISLSDFQSPQTKLNAKGLFFLNFPAEIELAYEMSEREFKKAKDFNGVVVCVFNTTDASIMAQDEGSAKLLVNFAQFSFDLSELYARKLRKAILEERSKHANDEYVPSLYDTVQEQLNNRYADAMQKTGMGINSKELERLHTEVAAELRMLEQYCKQCKIESAK